MSLDRLELDGLGSPVELARRIHQLAPQLPANFAIEDVCRQLGIESIEDEAVTSFEAALIMDANKAFGSIILAQGRRPERRRFSIAHELGHFLIPTHMPDAGAGFSCTLDHLRTVDPGKNDRRQRVEAEANRFAANLLMPATRIRSSLMSRDPDLAEVLRLASEFGVSREAMARGYIDAHRETLAVVILHAGKIDRVYRSDAFPWIEPRRGQQVPEDSVAYDYHLQAEQISAWEECDPETWLSESAARHVDVLSEQVLAQTGGWATVLLHAELSEDH